MDNCGAARFQQWKTRYTINKKHCSLWNAGWGCLRIGCWGEYLGLRGTMWRGGGENYIRRSLMICNPHSTLLKSRRIRWKGHVARMEEKRGVYRVLVEKPGGKRRLGRTKHRWEDNFKIDFLEVGWGSMDWIELAQDRDRWRTLVHAVMNIGFHKVQGISWLAENWLAC